MTTIFRKFVLGALIATLAITALPFTSAFAAGSTDPATPPAAGALKNPTLVNDRLELAFARQQFHVQRIGLVISDSTAAFARVQALLDKAKANGKDASAVQAAFDAFKTAFGQGQTFYEQAKSIAAGHVGFDANGKVTNVEQAKATVKSLNAALKQYRDTVQPAFKTLREAVKAFRTANPKATKTPTAP